MHDFKCVHAEDLYSPEWTERSRQCMKWSKNRVPGACFQMNFYKVFSIIDKNYSCPLQHSQPYDKADV